MGNIGPVHSEIGARIAEMHSRADRLSPLDIYARMDAIRQATAANGLDALEGLMHRSARWRFFRGTASPRVVASSIPTKRCTAGRAATAPPSSPRLR